MAAAGDGKGSVLVAGGAGYIGSHTVRALRSAGGDVVVLDDMSRGNERALLGASLVVGRLQDRDLVTETIRRWDLQRLIHVAASKAAGDSVVQPGRYFDANVGGSASLLRAVADAGVRQLMFSSSAAVYGAPAYLPIDEGHPLRPENPYGETKLLVEKMLP